MLARELERPEARLPHRARRHAVQLGHGGGRVGLREPALARRPRARRLGRQLRRALGEDGAGLRRSSRCSCARRGASGPTRPRSRAAAGRGDRSAVFVVHSETSTGVGRLRGDRRAHARPPARCSSSTPSPPRRAELETDAWGLDVVVTGSQKALMTPPGLAFASVSERALGAGGARDQPALLPRLGRARDAQAKGRHRLHAGHLAHRRPSTRRSS